MEMRVCFAVLLIFAVMVGTASALSVPLDEDSNAMPAWQGTLAFDSGGILVAEADFAVYRPKNQGGLYYGGSVPVPDDHYVYAYQIYNVAQEGGSALTTFTVGLEDDSGAANNDTDPNYGELGGTEPSSTFIVIGSFGVTFLTPQLAPATHSVVALFTSPYGPMGTDASVVDSGLSSTVGGAPTPVPEPASLSLLLALTGLAAVVKRRRG